MYRVACRALCRVSCVIACARKPVSSITFWGPSFIRFAFFKPLPPFDRHPRPLLSSLVRHTSCLVSGVIYVMFRVLRIVVFSQFSPRPPFAGFAPLSPLSPRPPPLLRDLLNQETVRPLNSRPHGWPPPFSNIWQLPPLPAMIGHPYPLLMVGYLHPLSPTIDHRLPSTPRLATCITLSNTMCPPPLNHVSRRADANHAAGRWRWDRTS